MQYNEATNDTLNSLYETLEPHLNQAEKEVYDGIVSNKSRLKITQKTGLTTQQQRTIEANIVAKGKQFISSDTSTSTRRPVRVLRNWLVECRKRIRVMYSEL